MTRVALVGFGEVGRIVHDDLSAAGAGDLVAWDVALADAGSRAARNATETGVPVSRSAADAAVGADVVVCAVTAASTVAATQDVAPGLPPDAFWFDLNSCSPAHKQQASELVTAAGGRYVEAALMSPIGPRRLESPFLLGGPHAKEFLPVGAELGFTDLTVYADSVGVAAAAKLCRSIIVKGLESLFAEALVTARSYGVERDVLASLPTVLPDADWERLARYFLTRSVEHGVRRSQELDEAAATVADAGLEPWLAEAASRRQAWAAERPSALDAADLPGLLDALRRDPDSDGQHVS
jgi:3-hydroxyisobutyrate dehydrogenase-like beta-hydroxyacid dehydrogenase